jgi:hypothetical protein
MDWIRAHRKLILAAITALLPQFLDGDTVDAIVIVVGLFLTGGIPNDETAIARLYPGTARC